MLALRSIAVELTTRCPQRCLYCYNAWRHEPSDPGQELPAADLCRLIDGILAGTELEHLTLTGGEPLLRRDLLDIIDHINARGLPVAIISNGGLVDEAMAAALAERRVLYVQVTFVGPDAAAHDALCGHGTFGRTARAVSLLDAAGVLVGGSFLCSRRNFAAAAATFELMHRLGVRGGLAFNRFNPSGPAAARLGDLLPTRSQVLAALDDANRFADAHDLTIYCTMPIPHCMVDEADYPRVAFGQCSAGTEQAEYAVDPWGRLKLCTLQRQTLGSLFETSLAELVGGEAVRRFRAAVPAFCRECPHRAGCLGGCGAAAEWVFGRADELDPFLAQHVRGQ